MKIYFCRIFALLALSVLVPAAKAADVRIRASDMEQATGTKNTALEKAQSIIGLVKVNSNIVYDPQTSTYYSASDFKGSGSAGGNSSGGGLPDLSSIFPKGLGGSSGGFLSEGGTSSSSGGHNGGGSSGGGSFFDRFKMTRSDSQSLPASSLGPFDPKKFETANAANIISAAREVVTKNLDTCEDKRYAAVRRSVDRAAPDPNPNQGQEWCLRYTKYALMLAGCLNVCPGTGEAKDGGPMLLAQGFEEVVPRITNPRDAPEGSVLIYSGCGHGHAEIRSYKGDGFYSDFHRPENSQMGPCFRLENAYIKRKCAVSGDARKGT